MAIQANISAYRYKFALRCKETKESKESSESEDDKIKTRRHQSSGNLQIVQEIQQVRKKKPKQFPKAAVVVKNPVLQFKYALDYLRHTWLEGHREGFQAYEIAAGAGVEVDQDIVQRLSNSKKAAINNNGTIVYIPTVDLRDKDHLIEHLRNRYPCGTPETDLHEAYPAVKQDIDDLVATGIITAYPSHDGRTLFAIPKEDRTEIPAEISSLFFEEGATTLWDLQSEVEAAGMTSAIRQAGENRAIDDKNMMKIGKALKTARKKQKMAARLPKNLTNKHLSTSSIFKI